jgi:murein DD-endopeptidase MepM/ murein hydrolase activator NlpD
MRFLSLNLFTLLLFAVPGCQSISTGQVNSWDRSHSIEVLLPKNTPSIKSDYGAQWSVSRRSIRLRPHDGIDIVAPRGHPVLAPLDGVVLGAGFQEDLGRVIHLEHQNPDGTIIKTSYFHLDQFDVEFGDSVARGQKIGEVGQTALHRMV